MTSFEEARRALRAIASAAVSSVKDARTYEEAIATIEAGLNYEEALSAIKAAREDMSNYTIGRVAQVTIEVGNGEVVVVDNVDVRLEIEQEHLDHYAMQNGSRVVTSRELGAENKSVTLTVNPIEAEELIRLIRTD